MADTPAPGARPLSEAERQAFQRLCLTEGHWAALAPAPLFYQAGVRAPNRRNRDDFLATERLRLALRTTPGLGTEAVTFWDRLGDGTRQADAVLAARLLAWHLATDLPFRARADFEVLLAQTADFLQARGRNTRGSHEVVVANFRWRVDAYLPYPEFIPNADPPRADLPAPTPVVLDAIAATMPTAPPPPWPTTHHLEVPRVLPTLARVAGEPVGEWWARASDPARRAVERGLAFEPFEYRRNVYRSIYNEWYEALKFSFPTWPNVDEFARLFVLRFREWVEAFRKAGRAAYVRAPRTAPVVPDVALLVAAPPPARTLNPEYVALPVALREALPVPPAVPPPAPAPKPPEKVAEKPVEKPLEKPRPERVTARMAEGFAPVPMSAAIARARAVSVAEVCAWIDSGPRLLFDDCREESSAAVAVVRTENAVPGALWVVGDLHADLLTLANLVAFATAQSTQTEPAHFLFLGDFVDRGIHDHATLLFLFALMMEHPERVCVVPGNHDTDLAFDETAQRFRVTIEPAEYCDNLNAVLRDNPDAAASQVALARAFVRFCARRPRAVFLPDGTMFAHGGFPHTDAQKDVAELADLCRPKCQDDFLWARIAESARVKRPNRGSRGHEFGWDTFAQFAKLAGEKLDVPVKRFVRGHDHVPDRWAEYPEYADNFVPVLTLNAMGRLLDGEPARRDGKRHPLPVVARHRPGRLPDVYAVPLDPDEVDRAFGRAPREAPAEGAP
jgi:hypothetical protein